MASFVEKARQPPVPVPLVLVSDPGQDLDDEMSYIMLRYLVKQGLVELRGIICTLAPAFDRARLCRGTLDLLGLHDCPVGIGTDGGDQEGLHTAKCFAESASSYMPAAVTPNPPRPHPANPSPSPSPNPGPHPHPHPNPHPDPHPNPDPNQVHACRSERELQHTHPGARAAVPAVL